MRSFVSLFLRLAAVGGKFLAMLVLADVGSTKEVGNFALFFGAINVLLFAIGLDFHQFTIRELLARRTLAGRARIILGQAALDGSIYALILIAALIFATAGGSSLIPLPLGWFVAILVCDHLSQELSRLFLVLRHAHTANIIYAIKTGLWGWVGAATIYLGWVDASAESFYLAWLLADILAIAVGVVLALRLLSGVAAGLPPTYFTWVKRGLKISRLFYVTSVATMCLAYLDRFVIAQIVSIEQVGLYAFWQSIASLVPVVVFAMAGMHFLPLLVEASKQGRRDEFIRLRHSFLARTIGISLAAGAAVLVGSPWVPDLLGKQEFAADVLLVGMLVGAACLNSLWQVPYQVLYSANDDRYLAVTLTLTTVAALLLNMAIVGTFGITGAATISMVINGLVYVALDRRARRHHLDPNSGTQTSGRPENIAMQVPKMAG